MKLFFLFFVICFYLPASELQLIKKVDSAVSQKIVVYGTSLTVKGPWVPIIEAKLQKSMERKSH